MLIKFWKKNDCGNFPSLPTHTRMGVVDQRFQKLLAKMALK